MVTPGARRVAARYIQAKYGFSERRACQTAGVYRSMVLQTIDADLGITKADVYYNLGYIHAQLGEINKAKGMMQRGLELDPEHARIKQALAAL